MGTFVRFAGTYLRELRVARSIGESAAVIIVLWIVVMTMGIGTDHSWGIFWPLGLPAGRSCQGCFGVGPRVGDLGRFVHGRMVGSAGGMAGDPSGCGWASSRCNRVRLCSHAWEYPVDRKKGATLDDG
jgi:hypothetical protein